MDAETAAERLVRDAQTVADAATVLSRNGSHKLAERLNQTVNEWRHQAVEMRRRARVVPGPEATF